MTSSSDEVSQGHHDDHFGTEHMEITGKASDFKPSKSSKKAVTNFGAFFKRLGFADDRSSNSDDSVSHKPLKKFDSSPGRTVLQDDDDEGDYEVGSTETGRERGEVEVEIESQDDHCMYRKRYMRFLIAEYKRQIILGCLFLFVFLFGVMVGACGTGQCRRDRGNTGMTSSAFEQDQSATQCNGNVDTNESGGGGETTTPGSGSNFTPIVNTNPNELFGDNVFIFDPSMSTAEIQQKADDIFYQQQNNEMGTERYALLFQPGTYGSVEEPLMLQIGYYTEISGLGASPNDVTVYGKIEVYNRCFDPDPYADGKFIPTSNSEEGLCFALNSFWRGLSNLSIQIVSKNQDACRATAMFWAISQAASMRRVNIQGGDVSLMDYCSEPAYASGGFIADSMAGKVISGSQQQFITRNSQVTNVEGAAWNIVFVGVMGAPTDDGTFPDPPITTFDTNPISREKPFLYLDSASGEYFVYVPSLRTESNGVSWLNDGQSAGRSIPIADFYVAKPGDSIATINEELSAGKHLLFTPGVYDVVDTIYINNADTVVLGIGLATLTAVNGSVPLAVASQPGIIIAGVTVDGGLDLYPILLQVGDIGDADATTGDPTNPITLSDVYFRIGGPHIGKANVCLEINSNHVLIDHTWVWRADHGVRCEPYVVFIGHVFFVTIREVRFDTNLFVPFCSG